MTAMDASRGADWSVGSTISTAGTILFSHFTAFVGTALVASLPSLIFSLVVPGSYVQSIIDLIIGQIVTVTLIYGSIQVLRGRQVSISDCFSQGFARLGTAIARAKGLDAADAEAAGRISLGMFFAGGVEGQRVSAAVAAWASALTSAFRLDFVVALGRDFSPVGGRVIPAAILELMALVLVASFAKQRAGFATWLASMCAIAIIRSRAGWPHPSMSRTNRTSSSCRIRARRAFC